jgi:hypothetical protein
MPKKDKPTAPGNVRLLSWLLLVLFACSPVVYGSFVLFSRKALTVPDDVYLYVMKPLKIIADLALYIYFAVKARAMLWPLHPRAQSIVYPGMAFGILVTCIMNFADIYKYLGLVAPDGSISKDPLICVYFSIITWTTVGFGDYRPTPAARPFAACEALCGYVLMGLFVGFLTQVILDVRAADQRRHGTGPDVTSVAGAP